jgi:hypothetical protein
MTYDDATQQAEVKGKLNKFVYTLFGGPLYAFFGPLMGGVHWNKETLDAVIDFKGHMQNIITKQAPRRYKTHEQTRRVDCEIPGFARAST